jgi:hypothetical protein
MTFPIIGSKSAPDNRPAAAPGVTSANSAVIDLVRLFALDPLPASRRRLVCHWRPQPDGRLGCTWEPEIVLIP